MEEESLRCDYVVARSRDGDNRHELRGMPARRGYRSNAALQGSHTTLEDVLPLRELLHLDIDAAE